MDDAFDRMMELMDTTEPDIIDDNIEDDDYNAELLLMEEQIRLLDPIVEIVNPKPLFVEIAEFDPLNNVMNAEIRNQFKTECILEESDIFTSPISTTNTMEGYLSNVSFHERELIEELIPDEDLVMYRCNYGKIKLPEYIEPVKLRKTNRGRKKKEKKKKLRKMPGDGVDFNSQITFVVRSQIEPLESPDAYLKVYKFKIFRTGKLQLPGVHPHLIDDVIECTRKISQNINFHLHPGEIDPTRVTNIININPVMKNYKFILKLPMNHIIDMEVLRQILADERSAQFIQMVDADVNADVNADANADANATTAARDNTYTHARVLSPEHPKIFMLKYTRQDTKLSIKFNTPIYKKPKKMTRINIFMRGKINILGAFNTAVTRQICEYLEWIFRTYYKSLVVREGVIKIERPRWKENIAQYDDVSATAIMFEWINWLPPLPYISEAEYDNVINFIDQCYSDCINGANDYLRDLLADTDLQSWISDNTHTCAC